MPQHAGESNAVGVFFAGGRRKPTRVALLCSFYEVREASNRVWQVVFGCATSAGPPPPPLPVAAEGMPQHVCRACCAAHVFRQPVAAGATPAGVLINAPVRTL